MNSLNVHGNDELGLFYSGEQDRWGNEFRFCLIFKFLRTRNTWGGDYLLEG